MQDTLFTILTNEQARNRAAIIASLDKKFSVGAPWWDKAQE
jgi:hypothetical protein